MKLIPFWVISGNTYPDYKFFVIDRRKMKKLKKKYFYLEIKNAVSIGRDHCEINNKANFRHDLDFYFVGEVDKRSAFHDLLWLTDSPCNQSMFIFFDNKNEYLKWKLTNDF